MRSLFSIVSFIILVARPVLAAQEQSVDVWKLSAYEAALTNDPLKCAGDEYCLDHARFYRSLLCIDDVCAGRDKSRTPVYCAKNFADQYTPEQQEPINGALCDLIRSPGPATRAAYLKLVTNEGEGEAVELGGYLMAMKGSAAACTRYIKNYVGGYGPRWSFQWYRALSGCRILARVRSRAEEEKDLNTWLGVVRGNGRCAAIINPEMRRACQARGAASPAPVYAQLW